MRFRKLILCGLATAGLFACGREPVARPHPTYTTALDTTQGGEKARIVVGGVDAANLEELRDTTRKVDEWTRLLLVTVVGSDVPIAGRYSTDGSMLVFQPAFPFDRGRAYSIRFDPRALPHPQSDTAVTGVAGLPRERNGTSTFVARVLPSADTLPVNLLRMYVEFSAPMSRQPGVQFIHLLDDAGVEVKNAFLPLDADFWNPDHTRYTVFLDPGRVKRGIRPNEQMGRALRAGHPYALVIDSSWSDAKGQPLAHPYRHEFWAGPAVETGIELTDWKFDLPRPGTRNPLVVWFPRPLDHGLLQRAIGVRTPKGDRIAGEIAVGPKELQWRFTPSAAWKAGSYDLVVLSILEDVAGNRVGRPFEVDEFKTVDASPGGDMHKVPFVLR